MYKLTKKLSKLTLFLSLVFLIFQIFVSGPEQPLSLHSGSFQLKKSTHFPLRPGPRWKTIVPWTGFNGPPDRWTNVFKRLLRGQCEESRCHLSLDRDAIRDADAVLFNVHDLERIPDDREPGTLRPPKDQRRVDQVYVFFSLEAPNARLRKRWSKYENFFNWTMTYRFDSDVIVPYGKLSKRISPKALERMRYVTQEELKSKKAALWMVSHCPTNSRRELLSAKLQQFMSVDVYGACGPLKCGQPAHLHKVSKMEEDPCNNLARNYLFSFAFENALCKDYVTEKMYRSLLQGLVPVVYGRANYSLFAPPNSYIDVKDFASVAELASHLKKVASNERLYNQYLKWQKDYDVEVGSPYNVFVCGLCKKLHDRHSIEKHQVYSSIEDWFVKGSNCDLPDYRLWKTRWRMIANSHSYAS